MMYYIAYLQNYLEIKYEKLDNILEFRPTHTQLSNNVFYSYNVQTLCRKLQYNKKLINDFCY